MNKKFTTILTITVILICVGLLIYFVVMPEIDSSNQSICQKSDEQVVTTVNTIQDYFQENSRFPQADELSKEFIRENNIDSLDANDPDIYYVYFKDNCKLQIKTDTYEVYSRY